MKQKYIKLCRQWYLSDSLEKFMHDTSDDHEPVEFCDAYKTSDAYFDADDRANGIVIE